MVRNLILLALMLFLVLGCGDDEQPEELLRRVRFVEVYESGGERIRSFSGVARAGLESRLSFKVGGTIQSVLVEVGDRVNPGDPIALLDASDYQLRLQQAQASLESARAQERNAHSNYERVRQLYENNNTSRTDLDAARAGYESAAAQVTAYDRQLELARLQLSYCRLTAPVAGAIASVNIEENENISPGQPVVQLTSSGNMDVEVAIPEVLISSVKEGAQASVEFDAIEDLTFLSTVTEVGVAAGGFATTYPVTVRLNESATEVRPGMAAEVSFTFRADDQRNRIIIPAVAVSEDRNGRFVFTLENSQEDGVGLVKRNSVVIGDLTADGIEIFEGISDGSKVITAGVSKLVDGQRVKI